MTFTHKPGSKPLPRYEIQSGIGRGGFGEVYFAVSDAGKEVALKSVQRNLDIELRSYQLPESKTSKPSRTTRYM